MKKHYIIILSSIITIFIGCNPNYDMSGMFNGSSEKVNTRFAESMAWNEANQYFGNNDYVPVNGTDYSIYICTDTHTDSTTHNLEAFMKAYRTAKSSKEVPFVIHLGDLINAKRNYPRVVAALQTKPTGYISAGKYDTIFTALGNHDIYFEQWYEYKQYFHTATYWFETRDKTTGNLLDLFICLDSAEGTLGEKQLNWLKSLLEWSAQKQYRHKVLFTHTHVFKQDGSQGHTSNYSMEETYEIIHLLSKYGVEAYWSGHDHSREITKFSGVTFITLETMEDPAKNPAYMIAEMTDKIAYDFKSPKE